MDDPLIEKFTQEIARRESSTSPDEDNLDTTRLSYVRWCNKEAMRLFPVAPFVTRILSESLEIDGYTLPPGDVLT